MIGWIKSINRKEQFRPGFLSVFYNPYFFNRRAIYTGIKYFSKRLSGRLLDFGCGYKSYQDLFEVDEYLGVDIQFNEGHDIVQSKVDVYYDGKSLPFEDNEFDSLYSSEVFEHVFNLDEMLAELNRVQKSGGLFIITMPFVWQEHEMPNDFGRYTSAGIKAMLLKNGFEIKEHLRQPNYIRSVFQHLINYIYNVLFPNNVMIKLLLAPFFIFPLNLLGLILGAILPDDDSFYVNHVILAQNVK